MSIKLNSIDNYEPIYVYLSETKTPVAYKAALEDYMAQGLSEKEARKILQDPYELEIYYEKECGLFAVDTEAVESGSIYSPFTGEIAENPDFV